MNYYKALQRDKDKRWDYTVTNDGASRPIGYCGGPFEKRWLSPEEDPWIRVVYPSRVLYEEARAKTAAFRSKYHSDGHTTEAEAYACYTEYLLDNRLREGRQSDTLKPVPCEICGTPTEQFVAVNTAGSAFMLCDRHRNREGAAQLFQAGQAVTS